MNFFCIILTFYVDCLMLNFRFKLFLIEVLSKSVFIGWL